MTNSVACPNGHKLLAVPALAGCTLPCPACGEPVVIPQLEIDELVVESAGRTSNTPATDGSAEKPARRLSFMLLPRLVVRLARGAALALAVLVGLWFVFVYRGREAEATAKLKTIGLTFQNFHDTHRMFAFPRVRDMDVVEPNRRPQPTELSWRVHLLPFLEHKALYDQFHLDEPWDSPHNLALADQMPEVYRLRGDRGTTTRFQVLTGPDLLFGRSQPARYRDVPDGPRSTILALVVGKDLACPWTKPDVLTLDKGDPLGSLGQISSPNIATVTVNGQVLILPADIEASKFLALMTPSGKEVIDGDSYRREYEETQWATIPSLLRWITSE